MRICIFTHTFPRFSGDTPAPFMENLAKALAGIGHKVFVLVPYDSGFGLKIKRPYQLLTYRYAPFEQWHVLGYSREFHSSRNLRLITYLLAPFFFFCGFISLLKFIKRENIDIVSSHWILPSGFITAVATLFARVPFTVTIPGSDIYLGGKNILFRIMTAFAAKRAAFVLSDNVAYMNELLSLGIKPKRKKIIVYGADAQKFKPTRKNGEILKSLGLDNKNPIILAVGRLVPKKGFVYLVQAMPRVLKKFPAAKLVIVGDGQQRNELESEIHRLGILDNVILAGTINYNELSKYYNLGDIFVMPSIRDEEGNIDASPVAMMEAMASGCPVVATKFSGSDKLVIEEKTGFLVKEKDSKALSRAIVKLLKVKSVSMRKNVRKIAVENFSTHSIAKKYTSIFEFAFKSK